MNTASFLNYVCYTLFHFIVSVFFKIIWQCFSFRFQLKLGGDPNTDIARIKTCRAVLQPNVSTVQCTVSDPRMLKGVHEKTSRAGDAT